jgi:hypothetical protein
LELYRSTVAAKAVLAACFTQASETYHHWKVFAARGACIEFDKKSLLMALKAIDGLKFGMVKYFEIKRLSKEPQHIEQLPFLKRYPYRDEQEFRVIYTTDRKDTSMAIPFPLVAVRRITLSPWFTEEEIQAGKRAVRQIDGCSKINVYRTTVLENENWKSALRACRS